MGMGIAGEGGNWNSGMAFEDTFLTCDLPPMAGTRPIPGLFKGLYRIVIVSESGGYEQTYVFFAAIPVFVK